MPNPMQNNDNSNGIDIRRQQASSELAIRIVRRLELKRQLLYANVSEHLVDIGIDPLTHATLVIDYLLKWFDLLAESALPFARDLNQADRIHETFISLLQRERNRLVGRFGRISTVWPPDLRDDTDRRLNVLLRAREEKWLAHIELALLRNLENAAPVPARMPRPLANDRYAAIDAALVEIAQARPESHKDVFSHLDGRVKVPDVKPFKRTGGWLRGFEQDPPRARTWLSKNWRRLHLPPFRRGTK